MYLICISLVITDGEHFFMYLPVGRLHFLFGKDVCFLLYIFKLFVFDVGPYELFIYVGY